MPRRVVPMSAPNPAYRAWLDAERERPIPPGVFNRSTYEYIEAERAAGRHGAGRYVCGRCREWVEAIYFVCLDGERICESCYKR